MLNQIYNDTRKLQEDYIQRLRQTLGLDADTSYIEENVTPLSTKIIGVGKYIKTELINSI